MITFQMIFGAKRKKSGLKFSRRKRSTYNAARSSAHPSVALYTGGGEW